MFYVFDIKSQKWQPVRENPAVPCTNISETEKLTLLSAMIEPHADTLTVDFGAKFAKPEKTGDTLIFREVFYDCIYHMKEHKVEKNPYNRNPFMVVDSFDVVLPDEILAVLRDVLILFSKPVFGLPVQFSPDNFSDIESYVKDPHWKKSSLRKIRPNQKINYIDAGVRLLPDTVLDFEYILPENTDEIYRLSEDLSIFKGQEERDFIDEVLQNNCVLMFVRKAGEIIAGLELKGAKIISVKGKILFLRTANKDLFQDFIAKLKHWTSKHGLKIADEAI